MAAISSNADGKWITDAATTWVGGVAPGEGDTATILNTHDVEIDGNITVGADTTTAAIQVNSGGSLFVPSTVAGDYTLTLKGDLKTDGTGGTINFGTSANPIPNTRTFIVKTNYSASPTDGKYGIIIAAGGTFNCQGSDPWSNGLTDPDRTLLAADASANATSITTADSTQWKADDRIYIAPTSRTYSEYDPDGTNAGQISSVSGTTINLKNFGGSGGGLKYAHKGSSPVPAEIINLTRNVIIQNYDGAPGAVGNVGYVSIANSADLDWVEFCYLGVNTSNKRGLDVSGSGTVTINRCSIHDCKAGTMYLTNNTNTTISNVVIGGKRPVSPQYLGSLYLDGAIPINNIWIIGGDDYGVYVRGGDWTGKSFSNIRVSGVYIVGIDFYYLPSNMSKSNLYIHSCGGTGLKFDVYPLPNSSLSNFYIYRNNGVGIEGCIATYALSNGYVVGNNGSNLSLWGYNLVANNVTIDGESAYSSAKGFEVASLFCTSFKFYNCSFGVTIGHTTADIYTGSTVRGPIYIYLNSTILGSSTEVSIGTNIEGGDVIISSDKHDNVAGSFKQWKSYGLVANDTSYYRTASPSQKLTPSSATYKLESGTMQIPVASGESPTISVYFRKSASYNGNQPRLIVKRNDALGITSDTVLATSTASVDVDTPPGTFTQLSGQPGAVSADGVIEVFVDCDGTAGYINICDWAVTGAKTQADNLDAYYSWGLPFNGLLSASTGGGGGGPIFRSGGIFN